MTPKRVENFRRDRMSSVTAITATKTAGYTSLSHPPTPTIAQSAVRTASNPTRSTSLPSTTLATALSPATPRLARAYMRARSPAFAGATWFRNSAPMMRAKRLLKGTLSHRSRRQEKARRTKAPV